MFQLIKQMQENRNNPMDVLKQITKNYSPEQMNGLFEKSKQFGVPDETIQQIKQEIEKK